MSIAEALTQAAEKEGWPATKLALAAGVTEGTALRWLAGKNVPPGDKLMALRKALPKFANLLDGVAA